MELENITKLRVKGLSNVNSELWINLPIADQFKPGQEVLLVDTDNDCVRGAIIIYALADQKKIKVRCVFRID